MSRIPLLLLLAALPSAADAAEKVYNVVVYGGTSAGVAAAIQTARSGKSVVLIEPGQHLGGLTTGGLGATDIGNKRAIGGISREFYGRVYRHYAQDSAWTCDSRDKYRTHSGHAIDTDTMWTFEPHVAQAIVHAMLEEAKVPVVLGQRLDLKSGVQKRGPRIVAVVMESGRRFAGRTFIDATYEGDLMAKAGVSFTVGREANATYGETLNGVQTRHAVSHQFIKHVDPFVKPGDPASGLLAGVHAGSPGEEGQSDRRVQAYNYRVCTTDLPENRRDWPKPAGYDPRCRSRPTLLKRYCARGWDRLRRRHGAMVYPRTGGGVDRSFGGAASNEDFRIGGPSGATCCRKRSVEEELLHLFEATVE